MGRQPPEEVGLWVGLGPVHKEPKDASGSPGIVIPQGWLDVGAVRAKEEMGHANESGLHSLTTVLYINRASIRVSNHKFSPVSQLVQAQLSIHRFFCPCK